MKKILITALCAISFVASASAVPGKEVRFQVQNAFESDFPEASAVRWEVKAHYAKATFVHNNVIIVAFYRPNGEVIGVSRPITLDQLPTNAKRLFAKKYADYTVKEAIQFDAIDETAYFISAENAQQSLVLKVENGAISRYKSIARK